MPYPRLPEIQLLLQRIMERRIVRYFLVAGAGAVVDIAVFAGLIYLVGVHYLWAGVAGFLLATLVNYLLSIRFVFLSGGRFPRLVELGVIYAVSATGLVWHQLILYFSVEKLLMHVMVAKLLALGLVFFWNYLLRKHFIFARKPGAP
jgi:putative flippase GtrA